MGKMTFFFFWVCDFVFKGLCCVEMVGWGYLTEVTCLLGSQDAVLLGYFVVWPLPAYLRHARTCAWRCVVYWLSFHSKAQSLFPCLFVLLLYVCFLWASWCLFSRLYLADIKTSCLWCFPLAAPFTPYLVQCKETTSIYKVSLFFFFFTFSPLFMDFF